MNNEEKILAILERMSGEIADLKTGQARLEARMDTIEAKVDTIKSDTAAIFEQTANLTEFQTEITDKMDDVLAVVKENTYDITRLKAKRA